MSRWAGGRMERLREREIMRGISSFDYWEEELSWYVGGSNKLSVWLSLHAKTGEPWTLSGRPQSETTDQRHTGSRCWRCQSSKAGETGSLMPKDSKGVLTPGEKALSFCFFTLSERLTIWTVFTCLSTPSVDVSLPSHGQSVLKTPSQTHPETASPAIKTSPLFLRWIMFSWVFA